MAGRGALEEAARQGNAEAVRNLLSGYSRPGDADLTSAISAAVHRNAPSTLSELASFSASHSQSALASPKELLSPLAKALHLGHLRCAVVLITFGAPVPQLPASLTRARSGEPLCSEGSILAWGEGDGNYALGVPRVANSSGSCSPTRLDSLEHEDIVDVCAAKFHSAALSSSGALFTWGLASGARLGHYQGIGVASAVIEPDRPLSKLASVRIMSVSLGKHHSIACDGQNVWAWGSNHHGQLGLGTNAADTQPVPKRISGLKAHSVVSVSCGNKHSGVVTSSGMTLTFGSNKSGQLGHGVEASGFSGQPRPIENLRDRVQRLCLGKHNTLVMREDGRVLQVGNSLLTPKKVAIKPTLPEMAGANASANNRPALTLHKSSQHHAVDIATGAVESQAVMDNGRVVTWLSTDPHLRAAPVEGLGHVTAKSVSSGKKRSIVTATDGCVYEWNHVYFSMKAQLQQQGTAGGSSRGSRGTASSSHPVAGTSPSTGGGAALYGALSLSAPSGGHLSSSSQETGSNWTKASSPNAIGTSGGELPVHAAARAKVTRIAGLQRVSAIAAGEKHCLAVQQHWRPKGGEEDISPTLAQETIRSQDDDEMFSMEKDVGRSGSASDGSRGNAFAPNASPQVVQKGHRKDGVESLKAKCEREAGKSVREERTAIDAMEVSDALGALSLRRLCASVIGYNLDGLFATQANAMMLARLDHRLLAVIERHLRLPWMPTMPNVTGDAVHSSSSAVDDSQHQCAASDSPPIGSGFSAAGSSSVQNADEQQQKRSKRNKNKKNRRASSESALGVTEELKKSADEHQKTPIQSTSSFASEMHKPMGEEWRDQGKDTKKKRSKERTTRGDDGEANARRHSILPPPPANDAKESASTTSRLTTLLRGGATSAEHPSDEDFDKLSTPGKGQQTEQLASSPWTVSSSPAETSPRSAESLAAIQKEQASARNSGVANAYAVAVLGSDRAGAKNASTAAPAWDAASTSVTPSGAKSTNDAQATASSALHTPSQAQSIPVRRSVPTLSSCNEQARTQKTLVDSVGTSNSTATEVPLSHLLKNDGYRGNWKPAQTVQVQQRRRNAWQMEEQKQSASPQTPPGAESLREIQREQQRQSGKQGRQKQPQAPDARATSGPWAMPPAEADAGLAPQTLTRAQAEEQAMRELKKKYGSEPRIRQDRNHGR